MEQTHTEQDNETLRQSALEHLWMSNRDWAREAEEGGPIIVAEADGVTVTDVSGRRWIDVNGGYASVNAGYGRAEISQAALEQMRPLAYYPQATTTEPLIRLAEKLARITPGSLERTWPVSGGSEANETAIKMARAFHRRMGDPGRHKVISRRRSYHGATAGVLWLGGDLGPQRTDYGPPYPGMVYAPQPHPYRCELGGATPSECAVRCAEAVDKLIVSSGPKTVAAVIAEPIAGHGLVPGDEYWPMLRDICDRHGVVLIADEIVCGFGRTGEMFGLQHWDVVPDIMTVAKGITSSYVALGAAIATREIADAFAGEDNIFHQALTFGGHPVTAAVALKNIEIIEDDGLVKNSAQTGAYFMDALQDMMERHPVIGEVRGKGLMIGLELVKDRQTKEPFSPDVELGARLSRAFRQRGLMLTAGDTEMSLTPPLCITRDEVDEIVVALDGAMTEVESQVLFPA